MFKILTTLVRGRSHDAIDALTDANALAILRQQLRDAAAGVEATKRSVAVVMAYSAREKRNAEKLAEQIADLETRAIAAIQQDREDLATEAAAAIAELEAEKAAADKANAHYDSETRRLREQLSLSEQRLRALQRGKQLADAAQRTHRLRGTLPNGVMASLREAEETLERLQTRHGHADDVELAMNELNSATNAGTIAARLAAAGMGAPLKTDAALVLERLRGQAA
ncbi:MAG: PspA/IM30 family protein [Paracoccaceae bacterium]